MIHTTCKGLYDTLHLEFKELSLHRAYRHARIGNQDIELLVVFLGQGINNNLCLFRQFGKEIPLYSLLPCRCLQQK